LSKRGSPAFKALHHILSLVPAEIEERIAADDSLAGHNARVDVLAVKDVLKDVEQLLLQLTELISAKQAGRRPQYVLNHSACLAATAIKQAGLTLKPRRHTFKRPLPDVTGSGAEAFLGFFSLLDPRVRPATLARALLRDQPGRANKNTAESDPIKVGALGG
jgi:hypothetical protein